MKKVWFSIVGEVKCLFGCHDYGNRHFFFDMGDGTRVGVEGRECKRCGSMTLFRDEPRRQA